MRQQVQLQTIAITLAALVIGLAYLFGGFIRQHEWLIAPPAILCLAAAFWLGLRRSSSVRPFARLRLATTWLLAIAMIIALPAALRWASHERELRSIPIPPDAIAIQRQMCIVYWRPHVPPYSVRYATRLSFEEADAFLTANFVANGWQVGRRSPEYEYSATSFPNAYLADWRGVPPVSGRLRNYSIIQIKKDRYLNVTLFDAGDERWVDCEVQSEETPRALRNFWR